MDRLQSHVTEFLKKLWKKVVYIRSTIYEILNSNCIAGLIIYLRPNIDESKALSHDAACPNIVDVIHPHNDQCTSRNSWNLEGYILPQGLRNIDWKMQIMYMFNQSDFDIIKKCYYLFNAPKKDASMISFPLCVVSFGVFSSAAGSSEICLRRSYSWQNLLSIRKKMFCDHLLGVNVFVLIPPRFSSSSEAVSMMTARYLMLTARVDSFGLIPELSPGEISVVTSVIALLATIHTIGKQSDIFKHASNISNRYLIIAFFDGESFDYIGSSHTAYNMMKGLFPQRQLKEQLDSITASQLEVIIDLQQLGTGDGVKLNVLADGRQLNEVSRNIFCTQQCKVDKSKQRSKCVVIVFYCCFSNQLQEMISSLSYGARAVGGTIVHPTNSSRIPPSSWYSFSRISSSIRGIVLAPFREKYEYRRINSILDRAQWNASQRSSAISEVIVAASAVLRVAADYVRLDAAQKQALKIDSRFVTELFECLIDAPDWFSCDFLTQLVGSRYKPNLRFYSGKSTYPSRVHRNPLSFLVHAIAVYLIGSKMTYDDAEDEVVCKNLHKLDNAYTYTWQPDPENGSYYCYRSSVYRHLTYSPAFDIDGNLDAQFSYFFLTLATLSYLGYNFSNRTYSTWTESFYRTEDIVLYLIVDQSHEVTLIVVGLLSVAVSFLIVCRCDDDDILIGREE
ncbi:Nicastrin [Dictyocaulus viviparus]|uniref:Nicastrin n=1 Tax=Dictyocaulus viviparus TaxID=29172 RepID=A0A0D8Y433_DICVI|nr:Nicastrin [Dictyocaulus viviparus]